MALVITPAATPATIPAPDIVWDGLRGDFALVSDPSQGPAGGLRGGQALATAVLILLFTDAACDPAELRFEMHGDRRGWPGDDFDIDSSAGEGPMGSKLWLYRRSPLTDATARLVAAEARRALQPLIDQKACVRIDAAAVADAPNGRIGLTINLYGKDGAQVYARRFDDLWSALNGVSSPLA